MPELPEVETVRRGIAQIIEKQPRISGFRFLRANLRFVIPQKELRKLVGQPLLAAERRAKYLLLRTPEGMILSHLGMTGSWRVGEANEIHDHVEISLSNGQTLVYNDPRRFGYIDFVKLSDVKTHIRLKDLGPEPLEDEFNAEYLLKKWSQKDASCKVALMDQKTVVGVGNIYASEALYLAHIHPTKKAGKLKASEIKKLIHCVRKVLNAAIAAGGSSIRDFKNAEGESGYFQTKLYVYGRKDEKCSRCKTTIQNLTLGGRSTFFCPSCQKKK